MPIGNRHRLDITSIARNSISALAIDDPGYALFVCHGRRLGHLILAATKRKPPGKAAFVISGLLFRWGWFRAAELAFAGHEFGRRLKAHDFRREPDATNASFRDISLRRADV
jgi:hypothetical protein